MANCLLRSSPLTVEDGKCTCLFMCNEGYLAVCLCSLNQAVTLLSLWKHWILAWDGLHDEPGHTVRDLLDSLERGGWGRRKLLGL